MEAAYFAWVLIFFGRKLGVEVEEEMPSSNDVLELSLGFSVFLHESEWVTRSMTQRNSQFREQRPVLHYANTLDIL